MADLILDYAYVHGDNGAGLGASHQTGWTGMIGSLMENLSADMWLEEGRLSAGRTGVESR